MKDALVIQDSLRSLGGGELVCINTCLALQNLGYHVKLVSDTFRPDEIEEVFGLGGVVEKCEQVKLPELGRKLARFSSLPGIYFGSRSKRFLQKQDTDVMIVTRDPRRPDVLPKRPLLRFVYDLSQLRSFWHDYKHGLKPVYETLYGGNHSQTTFLALSSKLARELREKGYPRTELIYPSYGKGFRPRQKKNQVAYVTFLAPQKRLEDFMFVAARLPQYKFYLVGRDTERMNRIYNGYPKRILNNMPSNVEYIEARIRQRPEFLEETRIYLHTSIEPGTGIAVMEALSAGCIPVTPQQGGAGEILETAGVGFRYRTIEDAIQLIRLGMEQQPVIMQTDHLSQPQKIAQRARIFGPEEFQRRISEIIAKAYPLT